MQSTQDVSSKSIGSTKHVEITSDEGLKKSDLALDAATKGQGVTGYENLGVLETIKTFKPCTFICFAMAFSAATDGYQIGYVELCPAGRD